MFNFDLIVRKTNNYSFSSLPSLWFISENGGGGIVWGWGWNQKPQGHYSICNDTTAQKARCKGWLSAHAHTIIMLSAHAHTIITYPQNLGVLYESWSVWVQVSPQFCHVNSGVSGRKMGFWVQTLTFLLGFFGFTEPRASLMLNAHSLPLSCSLGHTWPTSFSPSFINPKQPLEGYWGELNEWKSWNWMAYKRYSRGYATLSFIWKWLKKKVRKRKINALITWKCTDQHLLVKKKTRLNAWQGSSLTNEYSVREKGRGTGYILLANEAVNTIHGTKNMKSPQIIQKKKGNSQETPLEF